eukprot:gene8717-9605_t
MLQLGLLSLAVFALQQSTAFIHQPYIVKQQSIHRHGQLSLLMSSNDNKADFAGNTPAEEKKRLEFIKKLNDEADHYAREGGFVVEEEPYEKPIRDTLWSGSSELEEVAVSKYNPLDVTHRPLLAFGDIVMFLIFALVGRANHHESLGVVDIASTAAPFIGSWLAISPFFGTYARSSTASLGKVFSGIFLGWLVSLPAALAARTFLTDHVPATPFIVVSMVTTLALLFGWRSLYIVLFGATAEEEREAGLFEIFKMVSSMMRRW